MYTSILSGDNWYPAIIGSKAVFHLFKYEYCLSLSIFTAGDELHWGDEIRYPEVSYHGGFVPWRFRPIYFHISL